MKFPRCSGVLLHPTSLPGPYGIGDLGAEAYQFVDFLADSGQHLWQLLPLTPTGFGDSPYQCFSAFAGNPLLISPEKLVEQGLLNEKDLQPLPRFSVEKVNFGKVIEYKKKLLLQAFENFKSTTETALRADFLAFCHRMAGWLEDYALFRVLKEEHGGEPWNRWEKALSHRDKNTLTEAKDRLSDQLEAEKFFQYLFFKQWYALREYCHSKKVSIIGDTPIFVAYDSADVWEHPELFKLNQDGEPTVIAGVPPDYFSATGQLWGNPLYDWEEMSKDGYKWWIDRFKAMLDVVDIVRIDHFRGFAACWEIPFGDKTAQRGRWVEVPGREFFTALKKELGEVPIIVEDLGVITPDVEALRDDFGFPGMRVLQMGFGTDSCNIDLPHNHVRNAVVYTGTHDNDTAVGWFNSKAGAGSTRDASQITVERERCMRYFKSNGKEIHWDFIEAAYSSVCDLAIIPLQDILGLGSRSRMNLPASTEGNWCWRFKSDNLSPELSGRLKNLIEFYGRDNAYQPSASSVSQRTLV
ncbi:MAG: 4-alpha-glucanotransferase [Candidatus Obscuribacterales bacterium]|nr:4-alpha-glucanotransferase [Candidatus Obscuribacterales bacterium]